MGVHHGTEVGDLEHNALALTDLCQCPCHQNTLWYRQILFSQQLYRLLSCAVMSITERAGISIVSDSDSLGGGVEGKVEIGTSRLGSSPRASVVSLQSITASWRTRKSVPRMHSTDRFLTTVNSWSAPNFPNDTCRDSYNG